MADEPTHVLISFCETAPGAPSLAVFEIATATVDVLRVPDALSRHGGVTGLAVTEQYVFVMTQRTAGWTDVGRPSPSTLVILDRRNLTLVSEHLCPSAIDAHSLRAIDDALYVVSTGTDEVVRLVLRGAEVISETVVWRPDPEGPRTDIHHLNAITSWRGDIVVSGFGRRTGPLWGSAIDGFLQRMNSAERLLTGIRHPHSAVEVGGAVAYCESATSTVHVMGTGRAGRVPGYARGMCCVGNRLFVGTSRGRRTSKSTDMLTTRADPGVADGRCSLVQLRTDDLAVERIVDLDLLGWEIYELEPVSGVNAWPRAAEIEWRDGLIAGLRGACEERDATVCWLHNEVSQRDSDIARLHGAVRDRNRTISQLSEALAAHDSSVPQIRKE